MICKNESVRDKFHRYSGICEIFFSQPISFYDELVSNEYVDRIDFARYHVVITGLSRRIYRSSFGIDALEYSKHFSETEREVAEILQKQGVQCLTTMMLYDHTKRFVMVFSTPENISAQDVAEIVSACFNRLYARIFDMSKTPYRNYTVLSEEIHGYENLQRTFREIDTLSRQQYFDMRSMVMTPSLLERTRVPADPEQIHEDLMQMSVAMRAGETEEMIAKYRAVMTQMEAARDFDLLSDALGSMRTTLEGVLRSHGAEPDAACRDVFSIENYPTFQLQRDAIEAYLTGSLARIGDTRPMSALIQEAVRYIRHHYAEDISVADIAEHIGMSPSWLTKRFRQECGENILGYLLSVRVERAKALLTETDMLILEVACAVGFDTSRYFSSVFGRAVGMTPKAYRETHKK